MSKHRYEANPIAALITAPILAAGSVYLILAQVLPYILQEIAEPYVPDVYNGQPVLVDSTAGIQALIIGIVALFLALCAVIALINGLRALKHRLQDR